MSVPASAPELASAPVTSSETDAGQASSAMSQSVEESNTNDHNDTENIPLAPAVNKEMKTGLGRIGFHRLALGETDFNISDATFDINRAPGHMEATYVGHYSWLASWFPYNPAHITIYFVSNMEKHSFSIPEAILVQKLEYLQISHYINLGEHNDNFAVDVAKQGRKTMEESKRLNSIASTTQDGANKTIRKLPECVDYVTYRDPLMPGESKAKTQLFTI
ncbi:hypothetical protein CI238_10237 [Colletotrichum incanum]|uniref:Uncharacterized protein n=1 Tax=Colletotrichum incanum TaxID=1573173 RepID=A0A161VZK3_COLIC|nr:hypothetical protein CI238_10237 [Colletotrichum incanum]